MSFKTNEEGIAVAIKFIQQDAATLRDAYNERKNEYALFEPVNGSGIKILDEESEKSLF